MFLVYLVIGALQMFFDDDDDDDLEPFYEVIIRKNWWADKISRCRTSEPGRHAI